VLPSNAQTRAPKPSERACTPERGAPKPSATKPSDHRRRASLRVMHARRRATWELMGSDRRQMGRWAALSYLIFSVHGVSGCKAPHPAGERHWTSCSCEYVTDFDQPGHLAVEICIGSPPDDHAAESCARGLGVGAITRCACAPSGPARCTDRDSCRQGVAPP
jgi:hypothetical protein